MKKNNNYLDLFNSFKTSNSTVTELRVGVFAPITQITANSLIYKEFVSNKRVRTIETNWGSVKIKGNILTQIHKDIIDAIFATATFTEKTKRGNVALFFSSYKVQECLRKKSKGNSTWLKRKLDEIKTTNIEYVDKDGNTFDFNITDSGGYSVKKDSFMIIFTEGYMNFFQNQVGVNYKKELENLMKVDDPLIKAIIRFFFTHANNMQIHLINMLEVLGYPMSERSKRTAKKTIKDYIEILNQFNITIDTKTMLLSYAKLDTITHNMPSKTKKLQ